MIGIQKSDRIWPIWRSKDPYFVWSILKRDVTLTLHSFSCRFRPKATYNPHWRSVNHVEARSFKIELASHRHVRCRLHLCELSSLTAMSTIPIGIYKWWPVKTRERDDCVLKSSRIRTILICVVFRPLRTKRSKRAFFKCVYHPDGGRAITAIDTFLNLSLY